MLWGIEGCPQNVPVLFYSVFLLQLGAQGSRGHQDMKGLACFSPDSLARSSGIGQHILFAPCGLAELAPSHLSASMRPSLLTCCPAAAWLTSPRCTYNAAEGKLLWRTNNYHLCLKREGMASFSSSRVKSTSTVPVIFLGLSELFQDVKTALVENCSTR